MQNIPLHPVLVHFPIALAVLAPILALYLIASFGRRRELPKNWNLLVVVLALALLGGVAATRTGEAEEERVEPFVGHDSLEAHEELGESFIPLAAAVLVVALGVPFLRRKRRVCAGLALACLLGTIALAGVTLRIGRSGGELVYVRGAAQAYTETSSNTGAPSQTRAATHDEIDGHSGGHD